MKMTGSLLKEAREKQNLSISEVSMSTKINPKMISAIEEGREDKLPAKTFLKGFVRSYAIFLKLDVDTVMTSLQQDLGEKQEVAVDPAVAAAAAKAEVESPVVSANPRILKGLATGGVLFLLVMIVTVKGLVEKYEKEKAIDPVAQEEISTEEKAPEPEANDEKAPIEAAEAAPAEPAKPVEETKPVEVAATAPVVPAEAVKPEVKTAPAPASVVAAPTAPTAKPEIKVEAPKPVEVKVETKPTETASTGLKDNEIILEALDKVDITFAVNNGPSVRLSLQPAQVHTIKAKGQVAMDVSDAGAVNVILNGQDNGTLGDLGKPKKVKYP